MTDLSRFARAQGRPRRAVRRTAVRDTAAHARTAVRRSRALAASDRAPAPLHRLALLAVTAAALLAAGCAGKFMDRGPNPAFCDTSKVYSGIDAGVGAAALFWGLQVDMDRMTNHFTFKRLEDGSLGGAYEAVQLAAGVVAGASFLVEAGRSFKAANRCARIKRMQDLQRRDAERADTLHAGTRAMLDAATAPDRAALVRAEMQSIRNKLRNR